MYHVSSPINRESILKNGLLPSIGERRCFGNELLPPAIFLSVHEAFDTTFDDDIYWVDIDMEKLVLDKAMPGSFYTTIPIPIEQIHLIYKGTGKDKIFMKDA